MKTKIFGLAIILSLATMLGACEGGNEPATNTTSTPAATAGGEPADTGSPAATASPAATGSPAATATPAATGSPAATASPTAQPQ